MTYPNITSEEAERVFDYLNLQLDEVADCTNLPTVYAANRVASPGGGCQPVTKNMAIFTILGHIFHLAEDCGLDCDCGGERKKLTDYPAWIQDFYWRASACENLDDNILDGELACF